MAILEYERIVFSFDSMEIENLAILKIAYCYKELSFNNKAVQTLRRINFQGIKDSLKFIVRYEIALNYHLDNKFVNSHLEITKLQSIQCPDSNLYFNLLIIETLNLLALQKIEEADSCIEILTKQYPNNADSTRLKTLYLLNLKNPKKARIFSMCLPGAGQLYAGEFWQGLSSFGLVTGSAGFILYTIINEYYFAGLFTGVSLLSKFYLGGISNASYMAKKKNTYYIENSKNDIRKAIITN